MCFLNGDLGGNLPASVDFGTEEYYDKEKKETTYTKVPIETIIKEGVHTYAREPYYNIIINDLDDIAVELLEYRGDTPLYLLKDINKGEYTNFTIRQDVQIAFKDSDDFFLLSEFEERGGIFEDRVNLAENKNEPSVVKFQEDKENNSYTLAKVEYGQTVGYRYTDLIYAGDLISSIGESFTSILDKIVSMLGEFEYFYNLEGQFVFQKKKTYTQISWNNIVKTEDDSYAENVAYTSATIYKFDDSNLITSFQNNPSLSNLKNDYSIWGERETVSGAKVPIHYRYAIDKKPTIYTTLTISEDEIKGIENLKPQIGTTYYTENYVGSVLSKWKKVDWRELIYQMALDYYAYNQLDNYQAKLIGTNPDTCRFGITGYEQYYIDIQGFWREIYNEKGEWLYDNPALLNFWFDFMDADSEMGQYAVSVIGDRTKVVNDTKITSIYFREIPNLIFATNSQWEKYNVRDSGYVRVNPAGGLESMFSISSQGKSAQDKLEELLYNYSYCIESITLQAVPVYYLQPNTRIFVRDDASKINGEYIVSKISYPLTYNGIMSVTAIKAPTRII